MAALPVSESGQLWGHVRPLPVRRPPLLLRHAAQAPRRRAEHPEYHADLADADAAVAAAYAVEDGRTNPFLHLSMHLTISEQCSIDQPRGVRQAVELLAARRGSLHDAHHEVMECLGQMVWASQRSGLPPDGFAYLDCVRARATR
jgi:hypothetical protein